MVETEGGGPAFPCETDEKWYFGMTLRDYFAGQVIDRCLAECEGDCSVAAESAYSIADAMVEARERQP